MCGPRVPICGGEDMNLNFLNTFVAVVEAGNFSRAASRLHLSQPAVSMQMQSLAKDLDVELFRRSGHRLETTEAGSILYQEAKELLGSWQATVHQLDSLRQRLRGRLELGASTIPADYLLPPRLGEFFRLHPDLEVQMIVGSSGEILSILSSGRLDLAVVGYQPPGHDFESSILFEDELVAVFSPRHRLAGGKAISVQDLLHQPLLQRTSGSATRRTFEKALTEQGHDSGKLRIVMELGSTRAILEAAAQGLGVAVLSKLAADNYIKGGRLLWREVAGLRLKRCFWLVQAKRPHSPIHKAFVQYLRKGDYYG